MEVADGIPSSRLEDRRILIVFPVDETKDLNTEKCFFPYKINSKKRGVIENGRTCS